MMFFQLYSAAGENFYDFDIRNAIFLNKICISDIEISKFSPAALSPIPGRDFSKLPLHYGGGGHQKLPPDL